MKIHKSLQADSAGRINLGKECAGLLFILSHEDNRMILEPARIISNNEFDQNKNNSILLNDQEWAKFTAMMDSDDEPTVELRKLMKKTKS